jgi:hypothetical protein
MQLSPTYRMAGLSSRELGASEHENDVSLQHAWEHSQPQKVQYLRLEQLRKVALHC